MEIKRGKNGGLPPDFIRRRSERIAVEAQRMNAVNAEKIATLKKVEEFLKTNSNEAKSS